MRKTRKFAIMDPIVEQKLKEIEKLAARGVPPGIKKGPPAPVRFLQEWAKINEELTAFAKSWNERKKQDHT